MNSRQEHNFWRQFSGPPRLTVDQQREMEVSRVMGDYERAQVKRAVQEVGYMRQRLRRGIIEGVRAERARIEDEVRQELQPAADAVQQAIEAERERCLAICRLWPDNLMAKEIARRIQHEEQGEAR